MVLATPLIQYIMKAVMKQTVTSSARPARNKATLLRQICQSGPDLMRWRRSCGIARPLFAEVAHFSERKLATYEKAVALPENILRPVRESVRLLTALSELCGSADELAVWLKKPNRAFARRAPLELIRDGEADRLWEMVYQVRQATFA